jgi:LysM repeat protein
MKDDSELKIDDHDDSTYSPKQRRIGSGNSKSLRILLVVILVLVFAGGIFYFLSKRSTGGEASPLQLKVTTLEEKIAGLEKQLAELQGKVSTSGPDPALIHRVEALAQKIEALEKRKQPTAESKIKLSPSSKRAVSTQKRYHTVQKGETLSGISKKYGISLEKLRKQNNLSTGQPLRTGQKLLVSSRR